MKWLGCDILAYLGIVWHSLKVWYAGHKATVSAVSTCEATWFCYRCWPGATATFFCLIWQKVTARVPWAALKKCYRWLPMAWWFNTDISGPWFWQRDLLETSEATMMESRPMQMRRKSRCVPCDLFLICPGLNSTNQRYDVMFCWTRKTHTHIYINYK